MFDVRYRDYSVVGPGSYGDPVSRLNGNFDAPVTNLVSATVHEELWNAFNVENEVVGGASTSTRFAVGYRLFSDFSAFTRDPANRIPMVYDLSISAAACVRLDSTRIQSVSGQVGLEVMIHTGTYADAGGGAYSISGGKAVVLARSNSVGVVPGDGTTVEDVGVNVTIEFNGSVVIYPSFMAFNPLPLAVSIGVAFPTGGDLEIHDFTGDIRARLFRSTLKVFDPSNQ